MMMLPLLLVLLGALGLVMAQLPTFPDNIVIMPELDIVTVEGFNGAGKVGDYTGKKLQVQVVRTIDGIPTILGEAFPTVSGKFIAFDINHDFGYCWGAGSDYQVTPDIQPGDSVIIKHNGVQIASNTALPVHITKTSIDQHVVKLTGTGVLSLASPNFIECRIINPTLVNSIIGRADVRALPIIGTKPGATGYTAAITTNGDEFTCTFNFFDAANLPNPFVANTVFEGLMEVSSWIAVDAAGVEQGLTISEYHAAGGPMSGLCPPSPTKVYPDMPSATGGVIIDNSNRVAWNKVQNVLGAVHTANYYSVDILRKTLLDNIEIASAVVPVTTTTAQLPANVLLQEGDELLVRAWKDYPAAGIDSVGKAARLIISDATKLAAGTAIAPPTFSAISGSQTNGISLGSSQNLQVVYTITSGTTGVSPIVGAVGTIVYEAGKVIDISSTQTIVAMTIDRASGATATATATFTNNAPLKTVRGVTAVTAGLGKIRVAWYPFTASDGETINYFNIYALLGETGIPVLVGTTVDATVTSFEVDSAIANQAGLVAGKSYFFKVAPVNSNGVAGTLSALSRTPAVYFVSSDALVFTLNYNPGVQLQLQGTGTIDGAVISVIDPNTGNILGSAGMNRGAFRLRIRPVITGLSAVTIVSSMGYVAQNVPTV